MIQFSVKAEIQAAVNSLDIVDDTLEYVVKKKILRATGSKTRSKVKKAFQSATKRHTGESKKLFYSKLKNNGSVLVSTSARARMSILEYGGLISAKGNFLTFKNQNGNWTRAKTVKIDAHPFFWDAAREFLASNELQLTIDQIAEKELKKALAKRGIN